MSEQKTPSVSVIITCYNHGRFLTEAIESVLNQSWSWVDILVVDDGSTDNTRTVAEQYPTVQYQYQSNQGLSAARNTGIRHSQGDYLVFLDADDWLYPQALALGIQHLLQNPTAAFVSGGYDNVDARNNILGKVTTVMPEDHYLELLQDNYIGMHATVMYRRMVFDSFLFDVTLKACEDYDLYLKIARKYPIVHYPDRVAAYRQHQSNMSSDSSLMLKTALYVLSRQEKELQNEAERKAYAQGQRNWPRYYATEMYGRLRTNRHAQLSPAKQTMQKLLFRHRPDLYAKYQLIQTALTHKSMIERLAPTRLLRWISRAGFHPSYTPAPGQIRTGDLNRFLPISQQFGYDRGGPVDRYYIENFLQDQAGLIQGRVLEIGDNAYTLRFGNTQVTTSDVLHVHSDNPQATFVGDLSDAPHIPDDCFDCIILTQTLHLIYDFKGALATCRRILKPGGVLLLTVPGISQIDRDEWHDIWLWSFTAASIRKLLIEFFPVNHVNITTHGNVFIATAFLYGMGISEVTRAQLEFNDPHYQVIITAKAVKPLVS